MEKVFSEPLPLNGDKPVFFEKFDRFGAVQGDELCSFKVGAGDIDLNLHLNNAVYARYIEDVLENLQKGASQKIAELQINFQRSAQLGDIVSCSGQMEGNHFVIRGGEFFTAGGKLTD